MLLFHRKIWLLYLVATILLFSPFLNAMNEEEDEKDIIYTDVGAGSETGENSPAITSQIVSPRAVAVDLSRNLYITELSGNYVKKVDFISGKISTIAGNGMAGHNGDNIAARDASLNGPCSLSFDKLGENLYIAEYNSHRIRKIDMNTNVITTVAGTGMAGYSGDNMLATNAQLDTPTSVVLDSDGNIYVADFENNRVRKVDAVTKYCTTFAGTGVTGSYGDGVQADTAQFHGPYSLAVNVNNGPSDYLYIAESLNNLIRKVDLSTKIITFVAGVNTPNFNGPIISGQRMLTVDKEGSLFYSDINNNFVKKIFAATTNNIYLIAGNGDTEFNGNPHLAATAALNGPSGIVHDTYGNIYIAEFLGNRVRHVPCVGYPYPPTVEPTAVPSSPPTDMPSSPPTDMPSSPPTDMPSSPPTDMPS